jgi:hypothetical protein
MRLDRIGEVGVCKHCQLDILVVEEHQKRMWHLMNLRNNTYGDNHNFLPGFWHVLGSFI